jgi:universal stress protein E
MNKRTKTSIMVAIATVDRSSAPVLRKAATLARQRNISLNLVHVIALPYGPVTRAGASVRSALKQVIAQEEAGLKKLARMPQLRGLKVSTTVTWDYPASDAIIRQVLKRRPSLLIAESQRHARLTRVVLSNTDWDLIRNCPCPLLLSKSSRISARPTVVAALDPFHAHAKPASLDAVILETAVASAGAVKRVFAFHAHAIPQPLAVEGMHEPYWVTLSERELAAYDERIQKTLGATAKRFGIPDPNVTYVRGDVVSGLVRFAKRSRADLVVMGAVSRSGLARLFIGNTAEKLIDKLDCDVLVVKPRRFATPVKRRAARLMPYPPYPTMM